MHFPLKALAHITKATAIPGTTKPAVSDSSPDLKTRNNIKRENTSEDRIGHCKYHRKTTDITPVRQAAFYFVIHTLMQHW